MNSVGLPDVCGAASSSTPPTRRRMPKTRSVAKNRSATRPTKNGAAIAAIGLTVYGQCVSVYIPWFVMYTAIVVYHAPQTKNCRNIMTESRPITPFMAAP